jgi:hypothetical protein
MGEYYSRYGFDSRAELADCLKEYQSVHTDVVLRKLKHARTATLQTVQDLDIPLEKVKKSSHYSMLKKNDRYWQAIIEWFKDASPSLEALQKIEETLKKLPTNIRKYYKALVKEDGVLQKLISTMSSARFENALKAFASIVEPQQHAEPAVIRAAPQENIKAYVYRPVSGKGFSRR